jgi:hypothetical protein
MIADHSDNFVDPPKRRENDALVGIDLFSGRSLAAKKALDWAMARNLGGVGIAAADKQIVLEEIPPKTGTCVEGLRLITRRGITMK